MTLANPPTPKKGVARIIDWSILDQSSDDSALDKAGGVSQSDSSESFVTDEVETREETSEEEGGSVQGAVEGYDDGEGFNASDTSTPPRNLSKITRPTNRNQTFISPLSAYLSTTATSSSLLESVMDHESI